MYPEDQGSTSVELAVLTPMVLAVLALMIAAGRLVTAHAAVDHAAEVTARAASLARTATTAQHTATSETRHVLAQSDLHCTPAATVSVDTTGFARPTGHTAPVSAHVGCTVALADLLVPGLPGSVALDAEFTSPLDPYRGRT